MTGIWNPFKYNFWWRRIEYNYPDNYPPSDKPSIIIIIIIIIDIKTTSGAVLVHPRYCVAKHIKLGRERY